MSLHVRTGSSNFHSLPHLLIHHAAEDGSLLLQSLHLTTLDFHVTSNLNEQEEGERVGGRIIRAVKTVELTSVQQTQKVHEKHHSQRPQYP